MFKKHEPDTTDIVDEIAAPHSPAEALDYTASCTVKKKIFAAHETLSKRVLAQRQKQIDYGKNTIGYKRYRNMVTKENRRKHSHPLTPDKGLNISKRRFDQVVRSWRRSLHKFDPPDLSAPNQVLAQQSKFEALSSAVSDGDRYNLEDMLKTANDQLRYTFPPTDDDELL
ncbi:unnamed protein product [Albugo candida]|uniref:Histone RNA hairpin-binding protein RNA-binding domain-containing protein n=1 Tax=Albugo candida TaxID=65357 RepID=A0A024GB25_9STRA|nr:unnamed protein product [Albugo candida]|eukprot:CCI44066.1 unnamed protein product [Albugo candida]